MIVVAFMVTAGAVAVFAGLSLSATVSDGQGTLENNAKEQLVTEGAIQLATADIINGKLEPGDSKLYYVGSKSINVTVEDNSASVADTVRLKVNGIGALKFEANKVVSLRVNAIDNIWSYGIYSNNSLNLPLNSKVTGSVFVRNGLGLAGLGAKITKDLRTATSSYTISLLQLVGSLITGVKAKPMPSLAGSQYQACAENVLAGDQVLDSYRFNSDGGVVYVNGNLSLSGDMDKGGTFFVNGNVTVTGKLTQKGNGRLVVVTPGTITFAVGSSKTDVQGYFYAGTEAKINSYIKLKGAIAAGTVSATNTFEVEWDQFLTKKANNGYAYHAPSMWP